MDFAFSSVQPLIKLAQLHKRVYFSVFIGISGGLVWVGQGTLLIINSTKATISRNTGIFYFMFESSLVVGNTFIYIVFNGEKYIDGEFTNLLKFINDPFLLQYLKN